MLIRIANANDDDDIWRVIEPTILAGETYPLPRDLAKADALAYVPDAVSTPQTRRLGLSKPQSGLRRREFQLQGVRDRAMGDFPS